MLLGKTWYTLEEAEFKSGLEQVVISKWIEDGLIRVEKGDHGEVRINIDDLNLKVEELTGI